MRRYFLLVLVIMVFVFTVSAAEGSTIWAVGDGANGSNDNDSLVAGLVSQANPDLFLYLGDVYEAGTPFEYANYYSPTYGMLKEKTRPTPGNHEWAQRALGYDPYWGSTYTNPHYYATTSAGWLLVSLNSEEAHDAASPQLAWLGRVLAQRSDDCVIAYYHRPRFSAGSHGDALDLDPLWQALASHTRIVLNGHDHSYQRLTLIDGITEFVVGTGGRNHTSIDPSDSRLLAYNNTAYGALRLVLQPGVADYAFINPSGETLDSGRLNCSPAQPTSEITSLKRAHRRLVVRGEATSVSAPLLSTQLMLQQRFHGRCWLWKRSGLRRASCRATHYFDLQGTQAWAWRSPRILSKGKWVLTSRARTSVNFEANTRLGSNKRIFRVR